MLFQGPYKLGTVVGSLSVTLPEEPTPDPEEEGRSRSITLEKHDRLGSKQWSGEVTWEAEVAGEKEDDGSERGDADEGSGMVRRRSSRKYHRNQKVRGMEAYSSAGSVAVIF